MWVSLLYHYHHKCGVWVSLCFIMIRIISALPEVTGFGGECCHTAAAASTQGLMFDDGDILDADAESLFLIAGFAALKLCNLLLFGATIG